MLGDVAEQNVFAHFLVATSVKKSAENVIPFNISSSAPLIFSSKRLMKSA